MRQLRAVSGLLVLGLAFASATALYACDNGTVDTALPVYQPPGPGTGLPDSSTPADATATDAQTDAPSDAHSDAADAAPGTDGGDAAPTLDGGDGGVTGDGAAEDGDAGAALDAADASG
jgi:hypothetical protein